MSKYIRGTRLFVGILAACVCVAAVSLLAFALPDAVWAEEGKQNPGAVQLTTDASSQQEASAQVAAASGVQVRAASAEKVYTTSGLLSAAQRSHSQLQELWLSMPDHPSLDA